MNKIFSIHLLLLFACNAPLFSQERAVNLSIESFYKNNNTITAKDYDARDFRDVYPYDPGDYLMRGREKFESEFYEEALLDFNESIELYPECSICFYFRGTNYIALDSLNKAKSDFLKAIKYDPLLIEAYNDVSYIFMQENNPDSAKYLLVKGIERFPSYPLTYFNLGNVELYKGKESKAKKQFKKCLQLDSCSIDSYLSLSVIYLHQLNIPKAESYLNKVLDCDPDFAAIYFWKSILKIIKKKNKSALENVNKAIEINDTIYSYYVLRGYLNIAIKKYNSAIEDFTKAYTINPLESENYQGGYSYKRDQTDFQPILQLYAEKKYELKASTIKQLDQIICYLFNEEYFEGQRQLKKIISLNNKFALAYLLLGYIKEKTGDPQLAISKYGIALGIDRKIYIAYKRRAFLLQKNGDLNGAINDFTKMYALKPSESQSIKYRGNARFMAREYNLAILDFSQYLKRDTTDMDVYYNYGICLVQLGFFEEAIKAFEKVIDTKPKDTGTYYEIAKCKYLLGDTLGSMIICDSMLKIHNCHVQACILKGVINLENSNYDKALNYFNQSIECSPYYEDGFINRSIVYLKTEKYHSAMWDINKAITINPNSGLAYYLRAQIKRKLNDNSACDDLNKAIELGQILDEKETNKICH